MPVSARARPRCAPGPSGWRTTRSIRNLHASPHRTVAHAGKLWHNEAMTETNEISLHLFRVFDFVRKAGGWVTAKQIAAGSAVAERTSRAHALRLVQAGVF